MDIEHDYYIAGGDSLIACNEIQDKRQAAHEARVAYAKHLGATAMYGTDANFSGLYFKSGMAPEGFYRPKRLLHIAAEADGSEIYVPKQSSKAGKKFTEEMSYAEFCLPGPSYFGNRIGCAYLHVGMAVYYPAYARLGDKAIIHIPKGAMRAGDAKILFRPAGAVKIKTSRYWQLKEAAAVKKTKKGKVK